MKKPKKKRSKWNCPACGSLLEPDGTVIDCCTHVELGAYCRKCKRSWSVED